MRSGNFVRYTFHSGEKCEVYITPWVTIMYNTKTGSPIMQARLLYSQEELETAERMSPGYGWVRVCEETNTRLDVINAKYFELEYRPLTIKQWIKLQWSRFHTLGK